MNQVIRVAVLKNLLYELHRLRFDPIFVSLVV
jgi:hypothetical protein